MSTLSRTQGIVGPLALITMPAKSLMGPEASCSPGIHLAYTRSRSPGCTGMTRSACNILRGASVASTVMVIGLVELGWLDWSGLAWLKLVGGSTAARATTAKAREVFRRIKLRNVEMG